MDYFVSILMQKPAGRNEDFHLCARTSCSNSRWLLRKSSKCISVKGEIIKINFSSLWKSYIKASSCNPVRKSCNRMRKKCRFSPGLSAGSAPSRSGST